MQLCEADPNTAFGLQTLLRAPLPPPLYPLRALRRQLFIRDSSPVTPYALLLFGGEVAVQHTAGTVTVGPETWIRFRAAAKVGVLVKQLRRALDVLLAEKIDAPTMDITDRCRECACAGALLCVWGGGYAVRSWQQCARTRLIPRPPPRACAALNRWPRGVEAKRPSPCLRCSEPMATRGGGQALVVPGPKRARGRVRACWFGVMGLVGWGCSVCSTGYGLVVPDCVRSRALGAAP